MSLRHGREGLDKVPNVTHSHSKLKNSHIVLSNRIVFQRKRTERKLKVGVMCISYNQLK